MTAAITAASSWRVIARWAWRAVLMAALVIAVRFVLIPQFGEAREALLGVLSWRLVQYWLPMPLALVAYGTLRVGPLRRTNQKVPEARAAAG